MPRYAYRGKDKKGNRVQGILEGQNEESIATMLTRQGILPIGIVPASESGDPLVKLKSIVGIGKANQVDVIMFCRQMYTLAKSGVPLLRAVKVLGDSTKDKCLKAAILGVADQLESGKGLAMAMQEYPLVFTPLLCAMVHIGENTGNLEESFLRLSLYIERDLNTRKQIKAALRYPILVICAIGVAVGVINVMVIPAFAQFFKSFGAQLPWQTLLLLNTSKFTLAYWPYILMCIAGSLMGWFYYIQTDKGRLIWDRFKLHIPLVGTILNRALLARFTRTFAMTLTAGVPVLQGLTVCSRATDNAYVSEHIMAMRSAIERGESLAVTSAATGMFTPLVLQMVSIGEETGDIDLLLREVADHYEREVEYDIQKLGASIEPILIVVLAGMVLILALGVFLPMWDLGSVALHKG